MIPKNKLYRLKNLPNLHENVRGRMFKFRDSENIIVYDESGEIVLCPHNKLEYWFIETVEKLSPYIEDRPVNCGKSFLEFKFV